MEHHGQKASGRLITFNRPLLRNKVNWKLRKTSDDVTKQFCENLSTSKEKWKLFKKINSNKVKEKIAKLKEAIT